MDLQHFEPNAVTPDLLLCAQACGSVKEIMDLVQLDEGLPDLSREQARELMRHAKQESEMDQVAVAPTAPSVLSAKVDTALEFYIDQLVEDNMILAQISRKPDGKMFKLDQTGEVITPAQARERLSENNKELISIKKTLNEQVKAESGHGNGSSVSLSVDLGSIVTGAINNIKQAEVKEITV